MTDEQPSSPTTQPDTTPDLIQPATVKGDFRIGDRKFEFSENAHGSKTKRRTFEIWEEGVAGRIEYEPQPSPVAVDNDWYHKNAKKWYGTAALSVARAYVDNNSQWQEAVRVRIHGEEYEMNRQ
ncbi:hypothetical protein ACFYY8_18855 [Streptosporangium sp. NPDC001559]|uniref:hypothetical protein n=1 Tax=Streptosporangium sp. NPDC001559 TaxID=3366187 RepID=UPI0036E0B2E7